MNTITDESRDAVQKLDKTMELTIDKNQQYLSFVLGDESFAMDILSIKEIIVCGKLTKVPGMPSFMQGVINLRGMVMPVISLSHRLGKQIEIARNASIVVIEITVGEADSQEHYNIGVIVDAVNEVVDIPNTLIEPPPQFGTCVKTDFIEGIGKVNDQFLIILNLKQVLRIDEIASFTSESDEELVVA